jgi:tetratricopeptide (TPR) repeat protein
MGKLDEGLRHDREVARLGRRAKSLELRARASLGYASLGQMRGNYPELHRHAQRARRLAERAGLRKLTRDANMGLMIALGVARRFDEALIPAWDIYQSSIGDRIDEGEALQNIGQVLFEAGHLPEARAGFAAVVARELPVHILLAALGGLCLTSAETDQADTTRWAAAEIERLADSHAPRYSIAIALLESAIALARIGDRDASDRHRAGAVQLGKAHGFHEIVYRAESIGAGSPGARPPERITLTGDAAKVATSVAWLEPPRLPDHVAAALASL